MTILNPNRGTKAHAWLLASALAFLAAGKSMAAEPMLCVGAKMHRDIPRAIIMLRFGEGLYDGHAWIRLIDGGGQPTSYGLWPAGIKENDEYDRPTHPSDKLRKSREYCKKISAEAFAKAQQALKSYKRSYSVSDNNCTHFAIEIWNSFSGGHPLNLTFKVPPRLYVAIGLLEKLHQTGSSADIDGVRTER